MTPTARTLAWLRKQGVIADIVERRLPHAFITKDLFGFIDIVGLEPGKAGCLGVQTTSVAHQADRLAKIHEEPRAGLWLSAGNRIQVIAWAKRGPRGKRKLWTPTVQDVAHALPLAPAASGASGRVGAALGVEGAGSPPSNGGHAGARGNA